LTDALDRLAFADIHRGGHVTEQNPNAQTIEYTKPEIKDYGDLKELTAATSSGTHTDVPQNTPVPPFNIFS
jgi:hypothetical protein